MSLTERELMQNEIIVLRDQLRREKATNANLQSTLMIAQDDAIVANKRADFLDVELRRLATLADEALNRSTVLNATRGL